MRSKKTMDPLRLRSEAISSRGWRDVRRDRKRNKALDNRHYADRSLPYATLREKSAVQCARARHCDAAAIGVPVSV